MTIDTKRNSINIDRIEQIIDYFTFFPLDLNKFIHDNINSDSIATNFKIEKDNPEPINILSPGFGAGCMELPLILKISYTFNRNIKVLAIDKSIEQKFFFLRLINELNKKSNITRTQIIDSEEKEGRRALDESDSLSDETIKLQLPNGKTISFIYLIKQLEMDPVVNKEIDFSKRLIESDIINKFSGGKFDIICFSFILNHLHFWRSAISHFNNYLKENGKILVSEISGDNILINGDVLRWSTENADAVFNSDGSFKTKEKEILYDFFNKFYFKKFAVISDNNEVSAANIDAVKQFFGFFYKPQSTLLEVIYPTLRCSIGAFKSMIKNKIFSVFTEIIDYAELFKGASEEIKQCLMENSETDHFTVDFTPRIKWWLFPIIKSKKIKHFSPFPDRDQFNFLESNNGKFINEFKELINNSVHTMQNHKNMIFEIDFFGRKIKRKLLEKKIEDIIFYFRRFLPFNPNVTVANIFINYYDGSKSTILSSDFINNSEEREKIRNQAKAYFAELEIGYTQKKIIDQFTNLDYFYKKFKTLFNKPFLISYQLKDDFSCGENSEFGIDLTQQEKFYEINIKFIRRRKTDLRITFGKSINHYLKPKKNELDSIIESLKIILNIFGDTNLLILPLFRNSISDEKTITLKNIGAATLVFNNSPNYQEKDFYIWLLENIVSRMKLDVIVDFLTYQDLLISEAKKTAISTIMARNLSHNIGSHVLSSLPLEDIETRKYDISKFNSYLQQRMDFLARISTDWPTTGEYLCFSTDVMRNFLKQSLLLDKIIKDDGVV